VAAAAATGAPASQPSGEAMPAEALAIRLELPKNTDLVMVETAPERVGATAEVEREEAPRPRRIRPPKLASVEEPLTMVETRREPPSP
jgi:hypothetical protein